LVPVNAKQRKTCSKFKGIERIVSKLKKTFLLIANGKVNKRIIDKAEEFSFDRIIAVDGGAVKAQMFGLSPNVVIGDLDSLPQKFAEQNTNVEIIAKPSQEINDLEKALVYCEKNGAEQIVAIGITGERVDHTFNNFSVLAKFQQKLKITVFNEHSTIRLINSDYSFTTKPGQTISLIPLGKVDGIITEGLRFALTNESLELGVREGVSNEAIAETVKISLQHGTLVLFLNDID
jgi:thiamine pyrophosphokinase